MKFDFTRNKTAAAVSALLASAAFAPVQAVEMSANGLGDVGLSSYYTVRSGYQTNISVVNTSPTYVVAFKIRFHEYANSRDVRDFNVFLSPNDTWTATLGLAANGVPFLQTTDNSCTSPGVLTPNNAANRQAGFTVVGSNASGKIKQIDFTNADYTGSRLDTAGSIANFTNLTRAQEGYIEVIEMGVALPTSGANPSASTLASWAVNGPTQNCAKINAVYAGTEVITVTGSQPLAANATAYCSETADIGDKLSGNQAFNAEFCEPLNVLKVASNMVRVTNGVGMQVPVATLANFYSPDGGSDPADPADVVPTDLMYGAAQPVPSLAQVDPATSRQIINGEFIDLDWGRPIDAVSKLFMATSVMNEYRANASGLPQTAWQLTFPTKAHYVDPRTYSNSTNPFEVTWAYSSSVGGSCVEYELAYWDRDEKTTVVPVPPSPSVPGNPSNICYEANSLNFTNAGNLFGGMSVNTAAAKYGSSQSIKLASGFTWGWAKMNFNNAGSITDVAGDDYFGLPVMGFSLTVVPAGSFVSGYTTPHAYDLSVPD